MHLYYNINWLLFFLNEGNWLPIFDPSKYAGNQRAAQLCPPPNPQFPAAPPAVPSPSDGPQLPRGGQPGHPPGKKGRREGEAEAPALVLTLAASPAALRWALAPRRAEREKNSRYYRAPLATGLRAVRLLPPLPPFPVPTHLTPRSVWAAPGGKRTPTRGSPPSPPSVTTRRGYHKGGEGERGEAPPSNPKSLPPPPHSSPLGWRPAAARDKVAAPRGRDPGRAASGAEKGARSVRCGAVRGYGAVDGGGAGGRHRARGAGHGGDRVAAARGGAAGGGAPPRVAGEGGGRGCREGGGGLLLRPVRWRARQRVRRS